MCEFVSWVEHEDKLYYLTANLLNTKEGHGAIERYFGIKGKHHECTDFSSTQNFPDEIVKALQAGAFRGIGIPSASQVLTEKAYADYEYKRDPLYAEYTSKRDDLFWNIFMDKKNRVKAWK